MQLSLLDPTPIARRSDPVTSKRAARKVTLSGSRARQQIAVLELVCLYPGRTSAELAQLSAGSDREVDRHTAARRLPELEKGGHLHRGKSKPCSATGNSGMAWWPGAFAS